MSSKSKSNSKQKIYSNYYTVIEQLGDKGKEGITYLVESKSGNRYAMKTFKKTKSANRLKKEADLQDMCREIAPIIYRIDENEKYIVMEKMDKHLIESMKKKNGDLTKTQQRQIINIFKKLDKIGIFHGDSNILNYMYKGKKLYVIDFGMSKKIDSKLIKELGTETPNIDIMTLGLVLKLKELKCKDSSYSHLLEYVSKENKERFGLN